MHTRVAIKSALPKCSNGTYDATWIANAKIVTYIFSVSIYINIKSMDDWGYDPHKDQSHPYKKECVVYAAHSKQDKNDILTFYEPLTSQFRLFIIRYQNNLINSANSSRNSWYFLSISAIAFSYSSLPTDFPLIEYEAVEVEGLQFAQSQHSQSQSSSS